MNQVLDPPLSKTVIIVEGRDHISSWPKDVPLCISNVLSSFYRDIHEQEIAAVKTSSWTQGRKTTNYEFRHFAL